MQLIQTEKQYKNKIDISKITNTDIDWMLGNYFINHLGEIKCML